MVNISMNTTTNVACFALGVVVGFSLGSLVARKVYGKKIMEHIKKTDISGIEVTKKEPPKEESENLKSDNLVGAAENVNDHVDSFKTLYNQYSQIISDNGYSSEARELTTKYRIDPDDFGADTAYDTDFLQYFQDTEELIDIDTGEHLDVSAIVGDRNMKILDLADPTDTLYFRNEQLKQDYSIQIGELNE